MVSISAVKAMPITGAPSRSPNLATSHRCHSSCIITVCVVFLLFPDTLLTPSYILSFIWLAPRVLGPSLVSIHLPCISLLDIHYVFCCFRH